MNIIFLFTAFFPVKRLTCSLFMFVLYIIKNKKSRDFLTFFFYYFNSFNLRLTSLNKNAKLPFVYDTRDLLSEGFIDFTLSLAPSTGFEPASRSRPTAFKAAPSPPGQTAYQNMRTTKLIFYIWNYLGVVVFNGG